MLLTYSVYQTSWAHSRSPNLQLNIYQGFMTMTAIFYLLVWSGPAPQLPTELKGTRHIALL